MPTLSEELAEFIQAIKFEDIPKRVINLAKEQTISLLGAIYAGSKTPPSDIIKRTIINDLDFGIEDITIMPTGEKTNFFNAVMMNQANAIALDYDDYLFFGHTGVSVIPLAFSLSEKYNLNGKEFLTLIIIGNEIGGRIGASILLGPHNGQLWSYIHLAIASAMTSRALRLSVEQNASALSIAMYISTVSIYRGFFSDSKYLTTSIPTKIGIEAAYLAKNGFTGALDIFESPLGWCNFTADIPIPSFINSALGKGWVTETIAFKMVPGCAYVSAIADCLMEIFKEEPNIDYKNIKEVRVFGSVLMSAMDDLARPFTNLEELNRANTHVALNFYIPYNVAVMIIDKKLTAEQLTKKRYMDEEVHDLAKKVKTFSDLSMTTETIGLITGLGTKSTIDELQIYFKEDKMEKLDMAFGSKMVIEMNDGKTYKAKVPSPAGSPANRVPIDSKLIQEAKYIGMKENQIQTIINKIRNIEQVPNISDIIPLLCLK